MAAYTLAAGVVTNFDTLVAPTGNDTYTLNTGSRLLINTDTRYCGVGTALRNSSTGNLGAVNLNKGAIYIDGTSVRIIPFNAGSGNVPAIGTSIVEGGVSAYLLGVWPALNAAPNAVGSTMPISGWIKVKSVSGGSFSVGALTNIGATATGPDVVGWIEVVGVESTAIQGGSGTFSMFNVQGSWFDCGTTSGVANQYVQLPASNANTFYGGVQIETAVGSGVFEWWPNVGSIVLAPIASLATAFATDARAKVVWVTSQGLLSIGGDGTNIGAMLPTAGCKIRVPNITLVNTTSASMAINAVPNTNDYIRHRFNNAGGSVSINVCNSNWSSGFGNHGTLNINNYCAIDSYASQGAAGVINISQMCIGVSQTAAQASIGYTFYLTSCLVGGTISNLTVARSFAGSYYYALSSLGSAGFTFNNFKFQALGARFSAANYAMNIQSSDSFVFNTPTIIGGYCSAPSTSNFTMMNTVFCDTIIGTSGTINTTYAIFVSAANILIDGFTWLLSTPNTCQPYAGCVALSQTVPATVRNIGTPAAPLDLGTVNGAAFIVGWGMGGGFSNSTKIQRIYGINCRTGSPVAPGAGVSNILESVRGDAANVVQNTGPNHIARGIYGAFNAGGGHSIGSAFQDGFINATSGYVGIYFVNNTSAVSNYTVTVGNESEMFDGGGTLYPNIVGQQIIWETPYFIRGHLSVGGIVPKLSSDQNANFTIEYDVDIGLGFSGSYRIYDTYSTTIPDPITKGFKLRLRFTVIAANTASPFYIRLNTLTDSVTQLAKYPLYQNTLSLTGLIPGSDIVILAPGTSTEKLNIDSAPGTSFSWLFDYTSSSAVDICVYKAGYVPFFIRNLVLTSSDRSLPVAQVADRAYS